MDDPNVTWAAVPALLPTAVLYDVVLSAFVVPGGPARVASRAERGTRRHRVTLRRREPR